MKSQAHLFRENGWLLANEVVEKGFVVAGRADFGGPSTIGNCQIVDLRSNVNALFFTSNGAVAATIPDTKRPSVSPAGARRLQRTLGEGPSTLERRRTARRLGSRALRGDQPNDCREIPTQPAHELGRACPGAAIPANALERWPGRAW